MHLCYVKWPCPNAEISCRCSLGGEVLFFWSYLKKVWCSMQTFHNRFEARWLGSLKPMVLSNCSYLALGVGCGSGEGGVEGEGEEEEREEEEEEEGR